MLTYSAPPAFVWELVRQLRHHRLVIGIDDVEALRRAMRAGFGLTSAEALRELCVALWATSRQEAEIVRVAFARVGVPKWQLPTVPSRLTRERAEANWVDMADTAERAATPADDAPDVVPATHAAPGLPPLTLTSTDLADQALVLLPEYPLTAREVAQAWRRLRRPMRIGAATELDVEATVLRRSRIGLVTPPVTIPPRRNVTQLLLLVDRLGSMAPFHSFVDLVCEAIEATGRLDQVRRWYFHDCPISNTDPAPLDALSDPFRPELDAVLPLIEPSVAGQVYADPLLVQPHPLSEVLTKCPIGTVATVISDAGAARGGYSAFRLLDTLALLKALRESVAGYVWLNPTPRARWARTTAEQLARHMPMFPLDRPGMGAAVDVLRGRPVGLDRPL